MHISTAHAQKRLFRSFLSKTWPLHLLRRPRFPIRQMHFHYRVTFTGYIRCFCVTTSQDLVTLTFDLLTLRVSHVQCFSCTTHTPIFIILRLSVTLLWIIEFDHISVIWNSHCAWALSRERGQNGPHFWNPWPQFVYSLCHFQDATTKIEPLLAKIAFIPLWRLQISLRMRSITWPVHRGSPKTTRDNFWPRIVYSLYNFYGATTTIKGSFILEHASPC